MRSSRLLAVASSTLASSFATMAIAQPCPVSVLNLSSFPRPGNVVRSMTTWTPPGSQSPLMIAGGDFLTLSDGVEVGYVAAWNGSQWSTLSGGLAFGTGQVSKLLPLSDGTLRPPRGHATRSTRGATFVRHGGAAKPHRKRERAVDGVDYVAAHLRLCRERAARDAWLRRGGRGRPPKSTVDDHLGRTVRCCDGARRTAATAARSTRRAWCGRMTTSAARGIRGDDGRRDPARSPC